MIDPIKKAEETAPNSNSPQEVKNNNNSWPDQEAEYVQLPSQGVFYKNQYKGLKQLKVRKLNWEDEDILTTKSYYDNGTVFMEVLKNCIVDENGFPAKDLVNIDKDAILWWLRIGAFGADYTVPRVCANEDCKKKIAATWDLGSLEMPDFNPEFQEELEANGSVEITLPISKLKCKISISSMGRELEIAKNLKNKKEKTKSTRDFNITGKLISILKEVTDSEGNSYSTSEDILKWLNTGYKNGKIPMVDSRYIQERAKEIELNVDTKIDITCSHCNHTEEGVSMGMSINFFWPTYSTV